MTTTTSNAVPVEGGLSHAGICVLCGLALLLDEATGNVGAYDPPAVSDGQDSRGVLTPCVATTGSVVPLLGYRHVVAGAGLDAPGPWGERPRPWNRLLEDPTTCTVCRHAVHTAAGCYNMASDNDCACKAGRELLAQEGLEDVVKASGVPPVSDAREHPRGGPLEGPTVDEVLRVSTVQKARAASREARLNAEPRVSAVVQCQQCHTLFSLDDDSVQTTRLRAGGVPATVASWRQMPTLAQVVQDHMREVHPQQLDVTDAFVTQAQLDEHDRIMSQRADKLDELGNVVAKALGELVRFSTDYLRPSGALDGEA